MGKRKEEAAPDFKRKFEECNNRYESIFDLTSAASKVIDSDLKIIKVNQALTDLLGYSAEELEGTKILDYACKEHQHHWHDLQNAMWKKGKPFFKLDACIIKKDGSVAWIHVTTISFLEDNVKFGFTVLDDFTYRKSFEESEKRLRMALQYSKMAVWELNLADASLIHSDSFDQIFGYKQPKNKWDKDIFLNQFLPQDEKRLKDLLSNITIHSILDFQGRIKTPEGVIKWIYLQGKTEQGPDGRPFKILGTIYDITKEKLAERDKDDFISIASHELKTPITTLKASLQLLDKMRQNQNQKLSHLIEQANKSMVKVSVLIEDLLNASKMTEGQLFLKKTRFKLGNAIEECCHHVRAGGLFDIITEGDLDTEVHADSERIQGVVVNFANNAVKYAPDSKIIHIRAEKLKNKVKVSVIDNGPGIPKEKIPFLFDRYYRADKNGAQYSGLGLGLYISSQIIKKHNGEIGVYSEVGKGSTFWFSLPLK